MNRINIAGEDTPQTEFPSLLSNEPYPSKYLRRESHDSERTLRPRSSAQIVLQEKFVSIPMQYYKNNQIGI